MILTLKIVRFENVFTHSAFLGIFQMYQHGNYTDVHIHIAVQHCDKFVIH